MAMLETLSKEDLTTSYGEVIGIAETSFTEINTGIEFPQRCLFLYQADNKKYYAMNLDFFGVIENSSIEPVPDNIKDIMESFIKVVFGETNSIRNIRDDPHYDKNNTELIDYAFDEYWIAYAKIRYVFNNLELAKMFDHEVENNFTYWEYSKKLTENNTVDKHNNYLKFKVGTIKLIKI